VKPFYLLLYLITLRILSSLSLKLHFEGAVFFPPHLAFSCLGHQKSKTCYYLGVP